MNTSKRKEYSRNIEFSISNTFDDEKYSKLAYENSKLYKENKPFPHVVFDNFLPEITAEAISNEYP